MSGGITLLWAVVACTAILCGCMAYLVFHSQTQTELRREAEFYDALRDMQRLWIEFQEALGQRLMPTMVKVAADLARLAKVLRGGDDA